MTKGPHRETKRRHIVLSERIETTLAKHGITEIELTDGTVLEIPPPVLWGDDVMDKSQTNDVVGMAKGLIGHAAYAQYLADGGTAALLLEMAAEDQGVSVGESEAS